MRLAIGMDMGGTHIRGALVDTDQQNPTFLAEERVDVTDHAPSNVVDLVATVVDHVSTAAKAPIAGVGMGIAAMLRGQTGVIANAPNLGWRDVDLRGMLRERLGKPIDLYNDLNAIAWGEHQYGAGRGAHNILCVYIGTGIGGGIVLDDKLYFGAGHQAGEIGHTKVVIGPSARPCGCGQRGCVEAYAGGRNLQMRVRKELAEGQKSRVLDLAGGKIDAVHAGIIDQAARDGDAYAKALWAEVTPFVGLALANAVTLLNPDRLVLGGGFWDGAPEFRRLVLQSFEVEVNASTRETLTITSTALGDTAGMLGSAHLIAHAAT
jgi:glucokinase